MRLPPGEVFADNYKIISVLGTGGWADVYLAEQTALKRKVAIKILHQHLTAETEKLARFKREARVASLLKHQNICQVYDYGTNASGQPYCVMEFIEGETLAAILSRQHRLPATEAIPMFTALCDALATAHDAGILHRDIKPSNIMIAPGGRPVLVDFGVAKLTDDFEGSSRPQLTDTGIALGTAAYMSPEQCIAAQIDGRADIYSLACVIYQTLSGSLPIKGESDLLMMHAHVHEQAKPFSRDLHLPAAVEQAVLSALSKNVADRPASARSFGRQLAGTERPTLAPSRPRHKITIFAAAVALLLCIGAPATYWLLHQHTAHPPPPPPDH